MSKRSRKPQSVETGVDATLVVQPVILCGGSGTRLWPLSRAGFPKQFLNLLGSGSLFQLAVQRLTDFGDEKQDVVAPVIVGNEEHRFLILEQLQEILLEPAAILLEPAGRNTAPALTLAALAALESHADSVLVVTPADQTVADVAAFRKSLQRAIAAAAEGAVVVLGITPDRPETGYGYIQAAKGGEVWNVERFVEKPDLETARHYLAEGNHFWNGGIFVLKASVWIAAIKQFRPDIYSAVALAWAARTTDSKFIRPGGEAFRAVPSESIDYAVMEKCPDSRFDVKMVPLDVGWSDLGSWDAVWQVVPKDAAGNASIGDTLISDGRNVLVHSASRLVSVVGLENVVVVETADAVLVTDRSSAQGVREVVAELGARAREEHAQHRKVHRPWGWYDSIDEGPRFKVKRLMVKPGSSLSLQMHRHRAEHWVIVSGTAEITCGDKTLLLTENQSTYIPLGEKHRLANPGKVPLEIIEVQSGSYLGEDDIVRFDDAYGRK